MPEPSQSQDVQNLKADVPMTFSAAGRRLAESPAQRFLPVEWIALLAICILAVAIRASVMALLPSILHPDEVLWLEQANRLVNHQGLVPWDFQVGERSWLWPGLIAGFMWLGQLFGSPPAAGLGGVSVLICIVSLAPVICSFLWGRNVAGFPGAVIAGLLNAVWFELVYFYAHPLSESFATAALVAGLYLVSPGRGVPSERRLFVGAAMMGLTAVLRPQLVPAIAVAVVAVGGIRNRAHYPALLGGLALTIVLSGLLDWITWGWPFHSVIMYIYYQLKMSSTAGLNPVYSYIGWEAVAWGAFGVVIVLSALYGALRLPLLFWVAVTIFVVHSAIAHKEYRYMSPALPFIMTLAGVGSTMAADWLADRLGQLQVRRALMVAVPLVWTIASLTLAASPNRIWFWVRSRGSILAMRAVNADSQACGVGIYPGKFWWRGGDYVNLRPGIPLYDAGDAATPIAPDAYDYVISLQQRSKESGDPPLDLLVDFESLGYQQVKCWTDPYDRAMSMERTCLWRRAGTCNSKSAKLLTPEVGEVFESRISR
jgi:GPI mannosyltransferase 3